MDASTRADMMAWTGCIAGALTKAEFRDALSAAGLEQIEIRETHRVHEHAASLRSSAPANANADPEENASMPRLSPSARGETTADRVMGHRPEVIAAWENLRAALLGPS